MIDCPNCGKKNSDENKFCGECGFPLPDPKNYCWICDKIYRNGEKFCTDCGTELIRIADIEEQLKSIDALTPTEIRKRYSRINKQFISEGKIAGVEEIMQRAGVKYKIIRKNELYKILD